jgi:predicted RNA-binding Zn-ribbon protein involved in translation (DUF1610 family)
VPIQVTCPSCSSSFKAPDSAAGKRAKCPKCAGVIEIPAAVPAEEVYEAEEVPRPYDDADYEIEQSATEPLVSDAARKPCPMCGEMISRDAVKCRFCGEIFDPVLAAQEKKLKPKSEDEDLSAFEWVICILCSGIGCIVGIVYMIQGKPKGKKMFLISFCVQLLFGLLRVAIESANR